MKRRIFYPMAKLLPSVSAKDREMSTALICLASLRVLPPRIALWHPLACRFTPFRISVATFPRRSIPLARCLTATLPQSTHPAEQPSFCGSQSVKTASLQSLWAVPSTSTRGRSSTASALRWGFLSLRESISRLLPRKIPKRYRKESRP